MARASTLFDAATAQCRIARNGDFLLLFIDGSGAFAIPAQDFLIVQKWAQTRLASGSNVKDRARFLERIETMSARTGSAMTTRGSHAELTKLARAMKLAGMEIKDFGWPIEVHQALKPVAPLGSDPKKPAAVPDLVEPEALAVETPAHTSASPL